jgi:hypothetical protein
MLIAITNGASVALSAPYRSSFIGRVEAFELIMVSRVTHFHISPCTQQAD